MAMSTETECIVARAVAIAAHAGQVDKGGRPYHYHCLRVAHEVGSKVAHRDADYRHRLMAVAYLHDVIEDTPITLATLSTIGFSDDVIGLVDLLTMKRGMYRSDYIKAIKGSPDATIVKLVDIADNLLPARVARLTVEERARLTSKYARDLAVLRDTEDDPS